MPSTALNLTNLVIPSLEDKAILEKALEDMRKDQELLGQYYYFVDENHN